MKYISDRRRFLWAMVAGVIVCIGTITTSTTAWTASDDPLIIDLQIQERQVVIAENTIRITEGDRVQLNWTTDEGVELHLHGYDIHATARPGQIVSMKFQADTAGRFPITAHDFKHGVMIYLEVYPQ